MALVSDELPGNPVPRLDALDRQIAALERETAATVSQIQTLRRALRLAVYGLAGALLAVALLAWAVVTLARASGGP